MNRRHIPRGWTAEQAGAVADFLQDILDHIWDVHGREINEFRRATSPRAHQERTEHDELPF